VQELVTANPPEQDGTNGSNSVLSGTGIATIHLLVVVMVEMVIIKLVVLEVLEEVMVILLQVLAVQEHCTLVKVIMVEVVLVNLLQHMEQVVEEEQVL
jgi:hypothetical protein